MEFLEILRKYPVRNSAWAASQENSRRFIAEASSLGLLVAQGVESATDPWNRKFRELATETRNVDGDTEYWTQMTSVAGFAVECRIYND